MSRKHHLARGRALTWSCVLALSGIACAGSAEAQTVEVRIEGESPFHRYEGPFEVTVLPEAQGLPPGKALRAQWFDPWGRARSRELALRIDRRTTLAAPRPGTPQHLTLRLTPPPGVSLDHLAPGWSRDYGFAILPPSTPWTLDTGSHLGTIQLYDAECPCFGGWEKHSSWKWSPAHLVDAVRTSRAHGREDVPLIHGSSWDTGDDGAPISAAQLDAIGAQLGALLDELAKQGEPPLATIQAGLEVNAADDPLSQPYFLTNLEKKLARVRLEIDSRGLPTEVALSTRSFSKAAIAEVQAICASPASRHIDRLAHSLYDFDGGWRMPLVDGWLEGAIAALTGALSLADHPVALDIGEFGATGNAPSELAIGYPDAGEDDGVNEVASLSPYDHARYLVESIVVALSTGAVERVFLYHYQDNESYEDGDVWYAEKYFGTVAWGGENAAGHELPGHPFPSFTALATLHRQIGRHDPYARRAVGDVQVFEFRPRPAHAGEDDVLVVWVHPDGEREVALTDLRPGLAPGDVRSVEDLFGTPRSWKKRLAVDATPLWVRVRAE